MPSFDQAEFRELLDNDIMITVREKRQRRVVFGSLALLGLAATFLTDLLGVGGAFVTAALVLETLIGARFCGCAAAGQVKPRGFAGGYVSPTPAQTKVWQLAQRKQREYAVFRLVTQPLGAAALALVLVCARRASLDAAAVWADADLLLWRSLSWAYPLALLAVFGPLLWSRRAHQKNK